MFISYELLPEQLIMNVIKLGIKKEVIATEDKDVEKMLYSVKLVE